MSWSDVLEQWGNARGAADDPYHDLNVTTIKDMRKYSLRRTRISVAVTGSRGAGKSVLYDALAGKINRGYRPPPQSLDTEWHKVVLTGNKRTRSNIIVIPGQGSAARRDAEENAFGPYSDTTGVIHVVCWGRNEVWQQGGKDLIKGSIKDSGDQQEEIFHINMREELENFERTCTRLKDAWGNSEGVWLIVAVAKCDLYWKDLDDARDYYIPTSADIRVAQARVRAKDARAMADADPGSAEPAVAAVAAEAEATALAHPDRSAFAVVLRDLVENIGWSRFANLAVLPISSLLDTYSFEREIAEVSPSLDESRKNALSRHFLDKVGGFCGI